MKEFWNKRYNEKAFVYGKTPNVFFKETIDKLSPGKILLPNEGEGRNAVYAASKGWEVFAFDFSEAAKEKAQLLANEMKVEINYNIENIADVNYPENYFDVVALIYAHLPESLRLQTHQKIINWLKPEGKIIVEGFHLDQLNNQSGGPKDISMLYSETMLMKDFNGLNIDFLQTTKVNLNEGNYHKGLADVVRLIATKK